MHPVGLPERPTSATGAAMSDVRAALDFVDQRTDAAFGRDPDSDECAPILDRPENVCRRVLSGTFDAEVLDELLPIVWKLSEKVHTVHHIAGSCQEATAAIFLAICQQMLLAKRLLEEDDDA